MTLANSKGEEVAMTFSTTNKTMSMDRSKSGVTSFSDDFTTITSAPIPAGKSYSVRVFVDKSSIEVFDAQGRYTMTNIVFPNEPYCNVSINGGKATAKIFPLGGN